MNKQKIMNSEGYFPEWGIIEDSHKINESESNFNEEEFHV
jgi:hypothetical protein